MDVAIFVVDGVADFGFAALLETFSMANVLRDQLETPPTQWRVRTVGLSDSARSGHGHLVPTEPLADVKDSFELLIVPAVNVLGAEALIEMVSAPMSQPALERIRDVSGSGADLAAACTGTFFLAEAGVLDGAQATTSWWLGPSFRRRYPKVELDESRILCRSDRVVTAGATLSHMELALSLVHRRSPALAELVVRYMAVGDRRTQIGFSIPEVVARGDSVTAAFERWVRDHVADQFRIADVAKAIGVTERSLQRAVQAELGLSPSEFVNDIRLERATELLRTTSLTIDSIAARVGYLNAGTLRTVARRRRGVSLAEIRASRLAW